MRKRVQMKMELPKKTVRIIYLQQTLKIALHDGNGRKRCSCNVLILR